MPLNNGRFARGKTYKVRCPEGTMYVTIARCMQDSDDLWVNALVGKTGTVVQSDASAIATLVGIGMRAGVPAATLANALRGQSHEESNRLLFDALSIADGIGQVIMKDAEEE